MDDGSNETGLSDAARRFIQKTVSYALDNKARTPEAFLRHNPPRAIMDALADQPELRADILCGVGITGLRNVAKKKSPASAAEDLDIALAEGDTTADSVVELFKSADRAKFLSPGTQWAFLSEANSPTEGADDIKERDLVGFMLVTAFEENVLAPADFLGMMLEPLIPLLKKETLVELFRAGFANAKDNAPLDEQAFLAIATPGLIATLLPPDVLMRTLHALVATPHNFDEPVIVAPASIAPKA